MTTEGRRTKLEAAHEAVIAAADAIRAARATRRQTAFLTAPTNAVRREVLEVAALTLEAAASSSMTLAVSAWQGAMQEAAK